MAAQAILHTDTHTHTHVQQPLVGEFLEHGTLSLVINCQPAQNSLFVYSSSKATKTTTLNLTQVATKLFCRLFPATEIPVHSVCEIREGQEGSDPSKSMRDPCKVVMCRDPGWVY